MSISKYVPLYTEKVDFINDDLAVFFIHNGWWSDSNFAYIC